MNLNSGWQKLFISNNQIIKLLPLKGFMFLTKFLLLLFSNYRVGRNGVFKRMTETVFILVCGLKLFVELQW